MSTIKIIPLKPRSQKLRVTIGGAKYSLQLTWRNTGYVLDISDAQGNLIAAGLWLVTGADLLGQLEHLGISGALVVVSTKDKSIVPGYADLGVTSNLCSVS